ncbi:TetR/AcrR family transcriptional regulator [Sphingosinicella microcystinivorans]|uniref:TetR/AcrR family transcriptional regulator n=1 Tax=Sphingosinicella microcystinivorans TaxID=335406 RepID=UPI0022F3A49E|nr:TetR/AcrR family transcriptional regulator [Sphingosinicella microcystinivorans]WBX83766.1 TetR/AcrR family transcriptional regulator [Sphingosinicella microcystinivorans]
MRVEGEGQPQAEGQGEEKAFPRSGGYASPTIIERRHRILSTARKLITAKGIADLSMSEIAEQAQVAKRTLYNIFKGRDLLIAAAIQQYFEDYEVQIKYRTAPASAERMAEHLGIVARRNLTMRDYTRALLSMYFSADAETGVRNAIFEIAAHSHRPWIEKLHQENRLHYWIDPEVLVEDLVRYRYSVGLDWAQGRIVDDKFAPIIITGVLTMVAGASRPSARREIEAILRAKPWSNQSARSSSSAEKPATVYADALAVDP